MSLCKNHDPAAQETCARLRTIFLLLNTHHSYHHTGEDMQQLMDESKANHGPRTPLTFNIKLHLRLMPFHTAQ